jgi:hypothetical protein
MRRFIATPRVSKHRIFIWAHPIVCLDSAAVAIARDDDTTFGILHSRFHEAWSLRLGTWLGIGNDPRYTPTTTFDTFPFPEGLTPNIPAAAYASDPRAIRIAQAAKRLDDLRKAWLNPPDLICIEPEVVPCYPDRILPKDADAAKKLRSARLQISIISARNGSPMRMKRSTAPSPPPMAGPRIFQPKRRWKSSSLSISRVARGWKSGASPIGGKCAKDSIAFAIVAARRRS